MTKSRILVIHHGALGDVVATFPAFLQLKEIYGSLTIICQSGIGHLARKLDIVDKWFPLEAAPFATLYSDHIDPMVKDILHACSKIILFSRSRPLEKILISTSGNKVCRIPPRPDSRQRILVAEHILANLVRLDLIKEPNKDAGRALSKFICTDRRTLQYNPSKIIIHPGSGSRKKNWPISNFIKTALAVKTHGKQPEFLLGPAEDDMYDILMQSKNLDATVLRIENLVDLAELFKISGGFIGNDSGVSHLAAFIGLPTVVVFGPSDPKIWKPLGRSVKVVQTDLDCSPCFETGVDGCEEMECFNGIFPEDVLVAFYGLVG